LKNSPIAILPDSSISYRYYFRGAVPLVVFWRKNFYAAQDTLCGINLSFSPDNPSFFADYLIKFSPHNVTWENENWLKQKKADLQAAFFQ